VANTVSTSSGLPILSVRELKTYFFPDEGTVRAVDGASFDLYARGTLGIVGESGCGKSVTAKSILRIVERPGRIVGGSILLRRGSGNGQPTDLDFLVKKGVVYTAANIDPTWVGTDAKTLYEEKSRCKATCEFTETSVSTSPERWTVTVAPNGAFAAAPSRT